MKSTSSFSPLRSRGRVLFLGGILLGTLVLGNHVLLRSTSAQLANTSGDDRVVNIAKSENDSSHSIESEGTWYSWNWMNWTPTASGFNKKTITATFKDVRAGTYDVYVNYNTRFVQYMPTGQTFSVSNGGMDQSAVLNLKTPPPVQWNNVGWAPVVRSYKVCGGDVSVSTDSVVTGGSYAWMGMVRLSRTGDAAGCGSTGEGEPPVDVDPIPLFLDENGDGTVAPMEAYHRSMQLQIAVSRPTNFDPRFDMNRDNRLDSADMSAVSAYIERNQNLAVPLRAMLFMDRDGQAGISGDEAVVALQQHAAYVQSRGTETSYDINRDGSVNDADRASLFAALDAMPDVRATVGAFRYLDENADMAVTITEAMTRLRGVLSAVQNRSANTMYDVNGDGTVSPVDLLACANFLQTYAPLRSEYRLFTQLDLNEDRQIGTEELQRVMTGIRQAIASRSMVATLDMNGDGAVNVTDLQLVSHFVRVNPSLVSAF